MNFSKTQFKTKEDISSGLKFKEKKNHFAISK